LEVEPAELYWFHDIVGALLDYQRSQQETARAEFVLTAIGRKVWDTLDFALSSRRMVIIEGWEGRGKSEATKAWCRTHLGEARFVDLKGVTSKTTVFRAIAKALGIASTYSRTATEMQSRIEDVVERSRLMIVFDEAHYLFNQGARIYTRPELVDWIDTALCNHDVPVGLVSTPQLIKCVKRAETQVGWNWRQFRRRVRRWVQLAEWNTDSDLEAVARKIMPGISQSGIKLAIGYAKMSLKGAPSRDISGLGDVAMEAKLLAVAAGRQTITFEDIARAVNEHLIPSDTGFAERMAEPDKRGRRALQPAVKAPLTGGLAPRAATPLQPPKRLVSGVGCDDFSGSGRRSCSVEPGRALVPA
jgi:DNA transposition AAA+ family ATPase